MLSSDRFLHPDMGAQSALRLPREVGQEGAMPFIQRVCLQKIGVCTGASSVAVVNSGEVRLPGGWGGTPKSHLSPFFYR